VLSNPQGQVLRRAWVIKPKFGGIRQAMARLLTPNQHLLLYFEKRYRTANTTKIMQLNLFVALLHCEPLGLPF